MGTVVGTDYENITISKGMCLFLLFTAMILRASIMQSMACTVLIKLSN